MECGSFKGYVQLNLAKILLLSSITRQSFHRAVGCNWVINKGEVKPLDVMDGAR